MARVRKPTWLPYSVVTWGVCNAIMAGLFELSLSAREVAWAGGFPLTKTLLAALAVLAGLYALGRAAFVRADGTPRWRQARLPEPGEPPQGNRLAWPAPDGLPPRVATAAARALTQKRRPVPRDLGKRPAEPVSWPVRGFLGAVFVSMAAAGAGLVFYMPWANDAVFVVFILPGILVWGRVTVSIGLKIRRLNEDA